MEGPLHPSCHTFWVNRLWKLCSLQRWLRRTFICRAPTKAAHDNPAEILSRGIQQVIKDKHPSVWKTLWNRLMAKAHGCLNPCKQRDTKLKIVLVDFCARSNPADCVIQQLYSGMKSIVVIRRWNIFLDSYGIKAQTKIHMEKCSCKWPRFVPKANTVSFVFHALVFHCENLPASSLCWLFILPPQLSFFRLSDIPQASSCPHLPHRTLEATLTPAELMRSAFSVGLKRIVLPSIHIPTANIGVTC